jgi:protein Mpv17
MSHQRKYYQPLSQPSAAIITPRRALYSTVGADNTLDDSSTTSTDRISSYDPTNDPFKTTAASLVLLLAALTAALTTTTGAHVLDMKDVSEAIASVPHAAWSSYNLFLTQHPIATKALTSATVYALGDILAQQQQQTTSTLDRPRVLRALLAGLIGHGPLSHGWYLFCDHVFDHVLHITAWWSFVPKIVVDQTVWSPIWNNTFLLLVGLFKMDSLETIWADMRRTTVPLMLSGLKLWPLAHVITYGFIPTEHRLLWVDAVEIAWVTILSTQAAAGGSSSGAEQDTA